MRCINSASGTRRLGAETWHRFPAVADPGVSRVYMFLPKGRMTQGLVKFAGANDATADRILTWRLATGNDASRKLRWSDDRTERTTQRRQHCWMHGTRMAGCATTTPTNFNAASLGLVAAAMRWPVMMIEWSIMSPRKGAARMSSTGVGPETRYTLGKSLSDKQPGMQRNNTVLRADGV
jgi:hypothetical protein